MNIQFNSQRVLVTGASKGIGLACALAFGRAGAMVVGVSRSEDNLRQAREQCEAQGVVLHTLAADLTPLFLRFRPHRSAGRRAPPRYGRATESFA